MSMQTNSSLSAPVEMPVTRSSYKEIEVSSTNGGGNLVPHTLGEIIAFAELMARSQHAIPAHLRNNAGACMAVTMQAMRWEMDPFAVAMKSYNVKDLIAYEAQIFAAVVNTRAPIARRPDYEFLGEGQKLRCRVSVDMEDGSTKVYESPEIGTITVKNSPLWKADPQQQLGYYSIRAWARRYCPEVILGVYGIDEIDTSSRVGPNRARDVTPLRIANPLSDDLPPEKLATSTISETDAQNSPDEQTTKGINDETVEDELNENSDHTRVLGILRVAAMQGSRKLKFAWPKLSPAEESLVTAEDRAMLDRAAEQADNVKGSSA